MENEGMVFVYQRGFNGGTNSAKIGATEAKNHYNESLIVAGQVAQVSFTPTLVFLNLDKPFPDSPFSAVVFSRATNGFGDLSRLKGKDVEIKGTIKEYHGKSEIILEETNQLMVVGGRGGGK
jgi:DNA/RNA endonuclease YhcR with UshA esterase domain